MYSHSIKGYAMVLYPPTDIDNLTSSLSKVHCPRIRKRMNTAQNFRICAIMKLPFTLLQIIGHLQIQTGGVHFIFRDAVFLKE